MDYVNDLQSITSTLLILRTQDQNYNGAGSFIETDFNSGINMAAKGRVDLGCSVTVGTVPQYLWTCEPHC